MKALCEAIESGETTRYRIAKDLDMTQSQLSRLLTGECGLSIDAAERLADYLGLEIVIRPRRRAGKRGR